MDKFLILNPHSAIYYFALFAVPIVGCVIIALLLRMPPRYRRPLISLLVFFAGLFYAAEYFLPTHGMKKENILTPYIPSIIDPFTQVLTYLLLGQGIFSILRIHSRNVTRRRSGWINSFALLASALIMTIVAYWSRAYKGNHPGVDRLYNHLFDGMFQNMDAALFSIIAFYILSAAYRAFRIRSIESTILMVSALIVILGLSFGVLITSGISDAGFASNFRIESWALWILTTVSSPALRAIDFGVGIGALAMSLRLWLSIERGALFGD